jgi:hypothetical protein
MRLRIVPSVAIAPRTELSPERSAFGTEISRFGHAAKTMLLRHKIIRERKMAIA